ncbi:MAG: cbb3-type cytochrome oxidase subunit 3 [Roseivirga sp.]|jgi:cbb3-type cytochrome oxidase subunit 3
METIDGVSIYPILSFLIFFTLFVGAVTYILIKDRKTIEEISLLPLDNDKENSHEENR